MLKVFISYSHLDEEFVEEFKRHTSPLKHKNLIKEWYDRKILAGEGLDSTIENNLDDADIICLFISANYLASEYCIKEKEKAFSLSKKNKTVVIPIIVSECGWKDICDLSPILALPTDGKAISTFENRDKAWFDVYQGLKARIDSELFMRSIQINPQFKAFLDDSEMFSKAHSSKSQVLISDIFVYPELNKYNDEGEVEKKIDASEIICELQDHIKLIVVGDTQAGKTTLCKVIFNNLFKMNYIPVYIIDDNRYDGNIISRIKEAYQEQYISNLDQFEKIDKNLIVPIIDDFHIAINKDVIIKALQLFSHQILVVDDLFRVNIKDEKTIKLYKQYKIREFKASRRDELIKKWLLLDDQKSFGFDDNELYKELDLTTTHVNNTLGKVLSSGIMPSHPFFVLSVLSTNETFGRPLDEEITSQGYCYQALIYMYLRKTGVKNDEVDTYINFLTVLSYYYHKHKISQIDLEELNQFINDYKKKYNLPVDENILIEKLISTRMISRDSCGNYYLYYPYLYYFFTAKYISDHLSECKSEIEEIVSNLHIDQNAYILIFISHHTKDEFVLDELIVNSLCLFDNYESASLDTISMEFFDLQIKEIIQAVLPSGEKTPEAEREKLLKIEEEHERKSESDKDTEEGDEGKDDLEKDLRRGIKTVEVMGRIVKNRAGSLPREAIEQILTEGMNVHLRIMGMFLLLIKEKDHQEYIIDVITKKIDEYQEKHSDRIGVQKVKELSIKIFWNMNFMLLYSISNLIIRSLGSDKLQDIINSVCNSFRTPATSIIKHGTLMWYSKNIQIDRIAIEFEEYDFSETARSVMKHLIVRHSTMHRISHKDKMKIQNKLGINSKTLLLANPLGQDDK